MKSKEEIALELIELKEIIESFQKDFDSLKNDLDKTMSFGEVILTCKGTVTKNNPPEKCEIRPLDLQKITDDTTFLSLVKVNISDAKKVIGLKALEPIMEKSYGTASIIVKVTR